MWPQAYWCRRYWAPRYWAKLGATPVPPVGQSPTASRYRLGYRVDWVTGAAAVGMMLWG